MNRMTRALSFDLIGDNVIAISINPGWVQTDLGSADATFTVQESISSMLKVITELDKSKNGAFLNHDGTTADW